MLLSADCHSCARHCYTSLFMLKDTLEEGRILTDDALERLLPPATQYPSSIHQAMRHSVFAGGKRLRPILCMEAAQMVAGLRPARRRGTGRRAGDAAHLLAHPRRPARARQRRPAPRPSHLPQGLRRGHGHSCRRRAANPRLRGAGAACSVRRRRAWPSSPRSRTPPAPSAA